MMLVVLRIQMFSKFLCCVYGFISLSLWLFLWFLIQGYRKRWTGFETAIT